MFSPEEQQIEICLLKSNLEEIGADLLLHNSALPALDAANEQKYRETLTALKVARSLNDERERLNLENVKLTAKRMQLKQQCEDLTKSLERVRGSRVDLANSLKREEEEMETIIRKYEDSLRETAERFRKTRSFYDEEGMKAELEKANSTTDEFEEEVRSRESFVNELIRRLDGIAADLPENLPIILGKLELEEKIQTLINNYEALLERRNSLLKVPKK